MTDGETTTGWKFLRDWDGFQAAKPERKHWNIGEWYSVEGEINQRNGYLVHPGIYTAFSYVHGDILALVEAKGDASRISFGDAYRSVRVVKAWEWRKKDTAELAVHIAGHVVEMYEQLRPLDNAPQKSLALAREQMKMAALYGSSNQYAAAFYSAADAAHSCYGIVFPAFGKKALIEKVEPWCQWRISQLEEVTSSVV